MISVFQEIDTRLEGDGWGQTYLAGLLVGLLGLWSFRGGWRQVGLCIWLLAGLAKGSFARPRLGLCNALKAEMAFVASAVLIHNEGWVVAKIRLTKRQVPSTREGEGPGGEGVCRLARVGTQCRQKREARQCTMAGLFALCTE